jgi:hypothetical protein
MLLMLHLTLSIGLSNRTRCDLIAINHNFSALVHEPVVRLQIFIISEIRVSFF